MNSSNMCAKHNIIIAMVSRILEDALTDMGMDAQLTHPPKSHIYASVNWVSIGSDNGLSPILHPATN